MLAKCHPCKIRACITAKRRDKRQPYKQLAIGILPNQIHMGEQKKRIKKTEKARHSFQSVRFSIAYYRIYQEYNQKNRHKNIEIIIPMYNLFQKHCIKNGKGISNYMQPPVFLGKRMIKFIHANQPQNAHSRFQPESPADHNKNQKRKQ